MYGSAWLSPSVNRKNAAGEDRLFLICRTYQRFTKAGVCTCHSIKEKTVTDAVLAKVVEKGEAYGLPQNFVKDVFNAIHEASVEIQNEIISGMSSKQ